VKAIAIWKYNYKITENIKLIFSDNPTNENIKIYIKMVVLEYMSDLKRFIHIKAH